MNFTSENKNEPLGLGLFPDCERVLCPGGHLLSPTLTTIGPCRLNDRVRDGNGCCPAGSATKTEDPFDQFLQIVKNVLLLVSENNQ